MGKLWQGWTEEKRYNFLSQQGRTRHKEQLENTGYSDMLGNWQHEATWSTQTSTPASKFTKESLSYIVFVQGDIKL